MLGDFFQTGINAHIFIGINFSLLMADVNAILWSIGVKNGIRHRDLSSGGQRLDMVAMAMNNKEFRKYFVNQIIRNNP